MDRDRVGDEHEELEQIPWSELMTGGGDGPRRLVYLAAGAIAALALGMLVGRALWTPGTASSVPDPAVAVTTVPATEPPAATTVTVPPVTTTPATTTPATTTPSTTVADAASSTTTAATVPDPPVLYSEADLRAVPEDVFVRAAAARAEWFVTDFFTADLEPTGSGDVLTALPAGIDLPAMPQDSAEGLSYVEWARAFGVERVDDTTFRVSVAFRTLAAPPEHGFNRLPVRAVVVTVAVGIDGGTVVTDLPEPTVPPVGPEPDPWPSQSADPPQDVMDEVLASVAGWGSEPRLVAAYPTALGWRVVITAADEVGNRWPLAVQVGG